MKNTFRLASSLPVELKPALKAFALRYAALRGGESAPRLAFVKNKGAADTVAAMPDAKGWTIRYFTKTQAFRQLGHLLSGTIPASEQTPFEAVGVMIDCSRNAVRSVPYLKGVFERLALLGYNQVMLYCEDVFKLPDEPFFGLHRGGYTAADVRELDDWADALGIELVPCVETIGHMDQIFRWAAYQEIRDCNGILLAGEEKTYALIGKIIDFWSKNVRSRKFQLGMDEAWGIGTGEYKKRNGVRKPFEIMSEHLARLLEMCKARGLKPYMWSDMWFRDFGGKDFYANMALKMPEACRKRIPKDVTLCYWDYYTDKRDLYEARIDGHVRANGTVQMTSGIRTWNMFWHSMRHTRANAVPCIEAARAKGVKEILFTEWGDGGAFCDYESSFSGALLCADLCYGLPADEATLEKRYAALFDGASFQAVASLGRWCDYVSTCLMWEDPLYNLFQTDIYHHGYRANHDRETWKSLRAGLTAARKAFAAAKETKDGVGGSVPFARAYIDVLLLKMKAFDLVASARGKKGAAVAKAVRPTLRKLCEATRVFEREFRAMWMRQNRPQGLETTQIRLAGCVARADEALARVTEAARTGASIPEWEDALSVLGRDGTGCGNWGGVAHGTTII